MISFRVIKQFLLALMLGLNFSATSQCSYTLTLLDSYGDGWNGNSMYVQTSGYSPSTLTLSTGSSISYQISITTGDTLTFGWLGGGTYQDECTFTVTDNATGTTVYTSPAGNLMSTTSPSVHHSLHLNLKFNALSLQHALHRIILWYRGRLGRPN